MLEIQLRTQRILFAILGLIIALLGIRWLLLFFRALDSVPLGGLLRSITNVWVAPGADMAVYNINVGSLIIDLPTTLAIVLWLIVGLVVISLIVSLISGDPVKMIISFIDVIWKFLELLLLARIMLVIFGVPQNFAAASFVYGATSWTNLGLGNITIASITIEIGTLLALVVVLFVDYIWEGVGEDVIPKYVVKRKITTITTPTQITIPVQPTVKILSKEQFEELKRKA
jgi:hypothetical protein